MGLSSIAKITVYKYLVKVSLMTKIWNQPPIIHVFHILLIINRYFSKYYISKHTCTYICIEVGRSNRNSQHHYFPVTFVLYCILFLFCPMIVVKYEFHTLNITATIGQRLYIYIYICTNRHIHRSIHNQSLLRSKY